MKTKTERILKIMHVLSWIVFIGLLIKAGVILFSLLFSTGYTDGGKIVFSGLDLEALKENSLYHYSAVKVLMLIIVCLEAYIAYVVIKILGRINLSIPFKLDIAMMIEKVSYLILITWIFTVISNAYLKWLVESKMSIGMSSESVDFIFLAGIIFIMAQIFKRGIEIQSENELTI